jgi:WXG100 family type VII secretion target
MPASQMRADYDQLKDIAGMFNTEGDATSRVNQNLKQLVDQLQADWIGKGAQAFHQEMSSDILPAMKRLATAMQSASRITNQMAQVVKKAEDDASNFWKRLLS